MTGRVMSYFLWTSPDEQYWSLGETVFTEAHSRPSPALNPLADAGNDS